MNVPSFPIGPVRSVEGTAVVLSGDDIDTDRIIPARFLKCVTFGGLGEQVFADDRLERGGAHPFDLPEHQGARILLVNRNFGCGSSREHAPQALMRWGIRALLGESFAEIFFGNCLALGIPCLQAPHGRIKALQSFVEANPSTAFRLEVDAARLHSGDGQAWPLDLAPGPRQMLLSGQWDATGQLVSHDRELLDTAARLPYLNAFSTD
ncbi:3-isopropylmalate dehydratase small subunit [Synechococcus sp. Tobar12-5m-g]|uniref:3-isopropylmalate dehydratase small subunit n=1 Tax=unclassified Synechococcus TaxID=2626047 RepID=UPI0020CF1D8A|nr:MULTISPECIES: 3-isopropylmalate dehydratase small subunit [unclassified Synechococcus]MCP9771931.1 3-isopropylmalate dehydratase small subunit [Synechococcus sp. Tobar12-5m-g]MCP9872873.1 3-isopropylmalate dehydratase small subunit [Synechococcus sp. Cruz CV-v-12]